MASIDSRHESSPLITIVYLGLLSLLLIGGGVLAWRFWPVSASTTTQSNAESVVSLANAYDSPVDFKPAENIREMLLDQMKPEQSASRSIQSQLGDLERYIRNQTTGKAVVRPVWIGRTFVGVGINLEEFSVVQNGLVKNVRRYKGSETAPEFSGNRAFQQFLANTMAPVADCANFRINIRLEGLEQSGDEFKATLLVEAVGSREQSKEKWNQTGARKKVLQVSSVWQTTWAHTESKQLGLLTAKVPAAEIVALSLSEAQLFFDCTDSILAKSGCLREQLIFGVDQWAAKLPGIDTEGNLGLSVGDINGDGRDDIYVCQPQGVPNRLLIQRRDGSAVDESKDFGVNLLDESRSSLLVDLDNDGDQDLVVATKSDLVLFSNVGGRSENRFELIERIDRCCDGLSLSAADYDNDGDLDLFLCRQTTSRASIQSVDPTVNLLAGSVLLRNDESFRFVDVTASVGLVSQEPLEARSAIWFDRDLDGDQDLYVTAGKSGGVQFVNTDGFFKRATELVASKVPGQQSASSGDFNGDGRFDLLVASDCQLATSKTNESHVSFGGQADSAKPFFLRAPLFNNQYATTSLVADLDNDGRDDLLIGNGGLTRNKLEDLAWIYPNPKMDPANSLGKFGTAGQNESLIEEAKFEDYSVYSRQRNRCYASIGSNGFAEMSSASGLDYSADSRAMVATDWDHDGDTDVLVMSRTGPQLRVFINWLNIRNSISFMLQGEVSNRDAIGARIEVRLKGVAAPIVKTVQAGSGFLSQSSKRLTFGVGAAKRIESASVYWPSGKVHHMKQLSVGAMYELAEGSEEPITKLDDRHRLKIRNSRLAGTVRQPLSEERTLFAPRYPLPSPEVQVASGKWNRLRTTDGKPSVFLFWGPNAESEQVLEKLSRFVGDLETANADVVTVFTDSSDLRPDEQWKYMQNFVDNAPEIKNWTSLSIGGMETMKIVFAHWHGKSEIPESPFGLLVDGQKRVVGFYPVDSFRKSQLLDDLKLCDSVNQLVENESKSGFWVNPVLQIDSSRLSAQLDKAGFKEAASELLKHTSAEIGNDLKNQAKDFAAMGRYDLAQQYYKAALDKDPDNITTLLGRSNLAIRQALSANLVDLAETTPDNQALAVSDSGLSLPEAEAGFERVLELDPNEWRATIGIAKIKLLQDRPDEALATLVEHQEDYPRVEVLAMKGRVLFQAGKYEEAMRVLGEAHDERPTLPYLAGDLGYLHLINDEPMFARKLLRQAHQFQPSDVTFMRMLAEAEFVTGQFESAADLFSRVNRLAPDQLRSRNILAWLLATCPYDAQRDGVAALALIDPGSKNLVDQPASTLEIYAACYAEVGEFDKAIQFQQQAVDKVSNESGSGGYSSLQLKGMDTRLNLYRSRQPYRMQDILQTPINPNSFQLSEAGFKALRF